MWTRRRWQNLKEESGVGIQGVRAGVCNLLRPVWDVIKLAATVLICDICPGFELSQWTSFRVSSLFDRHSYFVHVLRVLLALMGHASPDNDSWISREENKNVISGCVVVSGVVEERHGHMAQRLSDELVLTYSMMQHSSASFTLSAQLLWA